MAKIILTGDPTSGKSTFLNYLKTLKNKKIKIAKEFGWQNIPKKIEANKLNSIFWFNNYFHRRDIKLTRVPLLITEYEIHFQYPYISSQYQLGLITKKEKELVIKQLNNLSKNIPLTKQDLVIHLTCDNKTIRERLLKRGLTKPKDKHLYWNALRKEVGKYYKTNCRYYKINTSKLTLGQVRVKIIKICKNFRKNSLSY